MVLELVGLQLENRALAIQPTGDLPRQGYYVARDILRMGNVMEATEGLDSLLKNAQRTSTDGWLDTVAIQVMLGESLYHSGNLAGALEHYDAAIYLAMKFPNWLDQFDFSAMPLSLMEPASKGINWFKLSRPSRSLSVPDSVQLQVDLSQVRKDSQGNIIAPVAAVTRLDSSEVLRTLGIALMRRWQILGPLAARSPLSAPTVQYFSQAIQQPQPWAQTAWIALRGLSQLAGDEVSAMQSLISSTLVANQNDYFMSPLTLLVLGQIAAQRGQYQSAIVHLQDASLLAAQYDQFEILAEALVWLGDVACANDRIDLSDPLRAAAVWCGKRTALGQAAGVIAATELQIHAGNFTEARKLVPREMSRWSRDYGLPRLQARLAYNDALLAANESQHDLAWQRLDAALNQMRGNSNIGAIPAITFQKQLTLDLLAQGLLSRTDGQAVLSKLLAEPGRVAWELQPLETLSALTIQTGPAYVRWLRLADIKDSADIVERMDRLQRQQVFESLPLGGRLHSWRRALLSPANQLPAQVVTIAQRAVQSRPELQRLPLEISALTESLRQMPVPLDDRQVKSDARQVLAKLEGTAEQFESQLLVQAMARRPMDRIMPQAWDASRIQKVLNPTDTLLGFAVAGEIIYAAAIGQEEIEVWQIDDAAMLSKRLTELYQHIGLIQGTSKKGSAVEFSPAAKWWLAAHELYKQLCSPRAQTMIENSNRLIIAPHGFLWYVPFELLIGNDQAPLISHSCMTYVPTLGSLAMAVSPAGPAEDPLIIVGNLFAADKAINQREASQLSDIVNNSSMVFLDQKVQSASAHWLKMRTDPLIVLQNLNSAKDSWSIRVLPLDNKPGGLLSHWANSPLPSPELIALPGLDTSIRSGDFGNGNDLLLPVSAFLLTGSQAIISRWSAGGISSSKFLQRSFRELKQSPSLSAAHRRAVLGQWVEQFNTEDEPVLAPHAKLPVVTEGNHPLLWAGYMVAGDRQSPEPTKVK